MKKQPLLAALAAAALTLPLVGADALATPKRLVVSPGEPMVLLPGLEHLGYSRLSTVEHCETITGVPDYSRLITDYEFESMEACLIEHT